MKSSWGVKVPPEHSFYAASYRFGAQEGEVRQTKREPQFFSTTEAYEAYCAGFNRAREESEKGGNGQ